MSSSPFSGRPPLRIDAPWQKGKDFTTFIKATDPSADPINLYFSQTEKAGTNDLKKDQKFSYSDEAIFGPANEPCRVLICPCFRGEYYSITVRRTEDERQPANVLNEVPASVPAQPAAGLLVPGYKLNRRPAGPEFLFDLVDYEREIWDVISESLKPHTAGLVVVAGPTAGGKSQITRGLINDYLQTLLKSNANGGDQRRPHLVTFEDPIEKRFSETPEEAQSWGFDYTPRQKEVDAGSLHDVLLDCLRQTPAAVYAGETREPRDWQALAHFAGSGHLVFTTCHAGSLSEVVTAIRDALSADTTSKRSVLASRLLAVIHLKAVELSIEENPEEKRMGTLPAVWLRTPAAINALTAEGPSVILPQVASSAGAGTPYCYGRSYFAGAVLKNRTDLPAWGEALRREAIKRDMEGL